MAFNKKDKQVYFVLTSKASSVLKVASFKEYRPLTEMNIQLKSQSLRCKIVIFVEVKVLYTYLRTMGKHWGKRFLFVFLRFCAYENADKDVYADNDDTCKRKIYLPFLSDELTTPDIA